jgi:hypothetical protein
MRSYHKFFGNFSNTQNYIHIPKIPFTWIDKNIFLFLQTGNNSQIFDIPIIFYNIFFLLSLLFGLWMIGGIWCFHWRFPLDCYFVIILMFGYQPAYLKILECRYFPKDSHSWTTPFLKIFSMYPNCLKNPNQLLIHKSKIATKKTY